MMAYIKIFLALLSFSILSSCMKNADIEIPNNKPELVVASFISSDDDSIRVKLSWTKPIYYISSTIYNFDYEDGATVVVSKGNTNYLLKYDNHLNYYISEDVNFKVGDKLKLRVTNDDKELISDCSIAADPLYEVEYLGGKYSSSGGGYEEYVHKVKLVCKNTQDLNYYRVTFAFIKNNGNNDNSINTKYTDKEFIELSNGESVEFQINGDWDNTSDSLVMNIINSDENYYKYHKTVINQNENEGVFTEPSVIYNNIDGGLGVFSSYSQKVESFFLN